MAMKNAFLVGVSLLALIVEVYCQSQVKINSWMGEKWAALGFITKLRAWVTLLFVTTRNKTLEIKQIVWVKATLFTLPL